MISDYAFDRLSTQPHNAGKGESRDYQPQNDGSREIPLKSFNMTGQWRPFDSKSFSHFSSGSDRDWNSDSEENQETTSLEDEHASRSSDHEKPPESSEKARRGGELKRRWQPDSDSGSNSSARRRASWIEEYNALARGKKLRLDGQDEAGSDARTSIDYSRGERESEENGGMFKQSPSTEVAW